ncbi:unnamed protein product, partial [marine sediment metagenome]
KEDVQEKNIDTTLINGYNKIKIPTNIYNLYKFNNCSSSLIFIGGGFKTFPQLTL